MRSKKDRDRIEGCECAPVKLRESEEKYRKFVDGQQQISPKGLVLLNSKAVFSCPDTFVPF